MNESSSRGFQQSRAGEAFAAEEARKSRLILEARLLRQRQEAEAAAAKFAEAAALEERLGELCEHQGLPEKSFVHFFSAASCWAQAGNFYEAILLCDRLVAEPGVSVLLRTRIAHYADTLRARRAQWYGELVHQSAESS
ncbi:MAG: hypothetical protein HUU20_21655 [Pirellulales bacterium]|nr:hypothetical protein [Pirellulales bacterium]